MDDVIDFPYGEYIYVPGVSDHYFVAHVETRVDEQWFVNYWIREDVGLRQLEGDGQMLINGSFVTVDRRVELERTLGT